MFSPVENNIPFCRILQDLVEADSEAFMINVSLDEVFINPELCSRDNFSVWDARKVKSKLSSVLLFWQIPLVSNWEKIIKKVFVLHQLYSLFSPTKTKTHML